MASRIASLVLLVVLGGCLDPYSPTIKPADVNILVVDGLLDTRDGTATVRLSRGISLAVENYFPRVRHAFVTVEDARGNIYPLAEIDSGNYQVDKIQIYPDATYRLHVVTSDDDEYYSDFVSSGDTPEIDSLTWITDEQQLTIRVNTHDPSNQTKYYRWTYEEAWNYHASLLSMYINLGRGNLRLREPNEMIYYCWRTAPSSSIITGSTARLSQSIISQVPIQYIPVGSKRLQIRYSILVKQRAINENEYNYLEQLKKTTESIGGLFDPQPFAVTGNVTPQSPASPTAVGYFAAGRTTQMRIYIDAFTLPRPFREIYPALGCVPPDTAYHLADINPGQIIGVSTPKGYTITSERCADCRDEGGVTTPPSFWH
jgi:hypothetical protein